MNVTMDVGVAQIEVTPEVGIDLAGFAVRPQPSTGVHDPLYARALYLSDGAEQLLWLHGDLLSVSDVLADRVRRHVAAQTGLDYSRIWISTTHTHSGPATFPQNGTGQMQRQYVAWLEDQFQTAALRALEKTERCVLTSVQGHCDLGVDRRQRSSAHTDSRVGALSWRRPDGSFKAVLLTYSMHPVCLRGPLISADWPGVAAKALGDSLPGRPVALVLSGACGNINPPSVGVTFDQVREWGQQIATSVVPGLKTAAREIAANGRQALKVTGANLELELEPWNAADIDAYATASLACTEAHREFGNKFGEAVEAWRQTMKQRFLHNAPPCTKAVMAIAMIGRNTLLAVNAEVFSRFASLVTQGSPDWTYAIGCTNGMMGYLPTREAYDEGAYEVEWSFFFYNLPRPRQGGCERLAHYARSLLEPAAALSPRP